MVSLSASKKTEIVYLHHVVLHCKGTHSQLLSLIIFLRLLLKGHVQVTVMIGHAAFNMVQMCSLGNVHTYLK